MSENRIPRGDSERSRQKRELLDLLLRRELGSEPLRAPAIPRREPGVDPPLSSAQRRLWFLEQLQPGTPAYNIPTAVRLRGPLDIVVLERAIAEIVRRHEALRTTFATVDGAPVQVVAPSRVVEPVVVDLAESPDAANEIARRIDEEIRRPFDLARGPLMRILLIRLAPQEHVLLTTFHHIVCDGWSLGVFVREIAALYEAFLAGKRSPLPDLPLQYADFAVWQRDRTQTANLEPLVTWWKERLSGAPPLLPLPTDRPRPPAPRFNGATRWLRLPRELAERLGALGLREGATPFMTLLAAFQVLLHRMTGQDDILVGTPIANRSHPATENLIGLFANTLVLRGDLSGRPSFRQFLRRTRETAIESFAHQELPFERLVEEIRPDRDLSHQPLFQVMFVLQNAPMPEASLEGLTVSAMDLDGGTAKFDLTLCAEERDEGLSISLEYNTDLFEERTIDRILGRFATLLRGIVTDPDRSLAELPILSSAEQALLLEWGGPSGARAGTQDGPDRQCLHELFEEQASRSPDAVALTLGESSLSYGDLNTRADRLAGLLREIGVGPETLVGLFMERSIEMVIGILGILKAGGAYVPLDLAYPRERQNLILEDSGARVVVTHEQVADHLPVDGGLARVFVNPEGEARVSAGSTAIASSAGGKDPDAVRRRVIPDDTAYVIYTSGSTGRPKGVPVSHSNVVRLFDATRDGFGFGAADVWTLFHSCAFDFSVWELWGALLHGGRLVVVPYWVSRNPEAFHQLLRGEGVTVLNQTPSSFRLLMKEDAEAGERSRLALRLVIFGGEALDLRTLKPWFDRHGDDRPRLVNMYGITETTVHVTCRPLRAGDLEGAVSSVIGGPIPDLTVRLLDARLGLAPIGVPAELCVGGPGLARGYLGRPDLTADRFVPDPYGAAGERLYRSGDLARYSPDGEIEYLGRLDHQVKIRGFRIELAEIEAAIDDHPAVSESVVTVRSGADGERRLVAYLVPSGSTRPGAEELRDHLRLGLPDFMIPSEFVYLSALPLTAHGKVDRDKLPAPAPRRLASQRAYAPPRSAVEEALAEVWAGVLGAERVGIDDNFFALGGDSIRSIQLRARARERGIDFSIPQLFHHQSIRELARRILPGAAPGPGGGGARPFALVGAEERTKLPPDVEDAYPLSRLQAGFVFHSEYSADYIIYITSFHLRAPFRLEPMRRALERAVQRHPMLRTSFDTRTFNEPLQLVHRQAVLPIGVEDLRGLPEARQAERVEEWKRAELRRRFDWDSFPLARVQVHLRANDTFQFSLSEPFLDGWSVASLLTEIFADYLPRLEGEEPPGLPPLESRYADFVRLERDALESAECRRYWEDRLADLTVGRFPRWTRPEGAAPDGDLAVRHIEVPVSPETSDAFRAMARANSLPLKSVLLAAHLKVVGFLTGQSVVVTGLISNGRPEETDGEQVVGVFLNTLPLRVRLARESWTDLSARVFDAEREMLPYRHFPMAELQRLHGGQPLFDTSFNYTNFHVYQRLSEGAGLEVLEAYGSEQTYFPLTAQFNLDPDSSRVSLALDIRCSEVGEAQSEWIAAAYARALEEMSARPAAPHDSVCLLGEPDRRRMLFEWNLTEKGYPVEQTIHGLIEAQVRRTPDEVAVVCDETRVTYRELDSRANRLARFLRSLGAKPELLVGICMDRSVEMVVAVLGVLKSGAAYVPIDPAYPKERIDFMLEDAAAPILLTQKRLLPGLPGGRARLVCLDTDWWEIASFEDSLLDDRATPGDLAYVLYTSGSTGRPKGAAVLHRSTVAMLYWARELVPAEDLSGVLASTSLCFDPSVFELFVPLSWGGKAVLAENVLHLPSLRAGSEVTLLSTVPSAIAELLKGEGIPESVGTVTLAGEPLKSSLVRSLCRRTHVRKAFNLYGLTEDTVYSTASELSAEIEGDYATIGRPIPNTRLYILDEFLQPVPEGVAGEIHLGGMGLPRGYFKRPELTAERFIPDPFGGVPGARLHKTGDLARYLPAGEIEFLGRLDHQVKVRGFRIELGEIEAVLAQHPAIREALVTAREDLPGQKTLVAYIVASTDDAPSIRDLRTFLREKLPDYMVPSAFVFLPALPLTPNGKVNRGALPPPDWSRPERESFAPPRTPVEAVLAAIWARVLRVPAVGIHDDFFELGGHSLLATQVVSRAREALRLEVPLRALFEAPTVAGLAARIESAPAAEGARSLPAVRPASREGDLPLSYSQQRLWFLNQLEPENPNYNVSAALRLRGDLDPAALERTLAEIVRRHESLRTTFRSDAKGPVQVIGAPHPLPLPVSSLEDLEGDRLHAGLTGRIAEEALRPFDLARGPLIRAALIRTGREEHVLVLTMHHIVSDGWSIGVLIREMTSLYEAFARGRPSPLADLPIQYADFAVWQHEWLEGLALEEQLGFWKERLSGAPELIDLPTDRARPAVQTFRGAHESIRIAGDPVRALRVFSGAQEATLFMTLLAAFQVLLHRLSGQDAFVIGTPIANRNRAEIEGLIGFFVNTLALPADCSGDPTFRQLVGRVRETALAAYTHQDFPFEKLVEALRPARDLGHAPLFQVMFVLQNAPTEALELPGLTLEGVEFETGASKFDLTLTFVEGEDDLAGTVEYATDLFDKGTIRQMLEQLRVLLGAAIADPDRPVSRLPLMEAAAEAELVGARASGSPWSPAEASSRGAPASTVVDRFEERVRISPGSVAVVTESGSVSYLDLDRRAEAIARALRARGAGPESRIGVCAERSVGTIAAILGVLKTGGAYLPLDPAHPAERLQTILESAAPLLVLASTGSAARLPSGVAPLLDLDDPALHPGLSAAAELHPTAETRGRGPILDSAAYVVFTSGSTGRPRGVVVTHRNLAGSTAARDLVYREPVGRYLLLSSFAFDSSMAGIFWTLGTGGALCLPPEGAEQDAWKIAGWIEAEAITHLLALPSLYRLVLETARPEQLSTLRCAIVAGEPCPAGLAGVHGTAAPGAALFNEYGPTEATVWATVFECARLDAGRRSTPIGRPIPGARLYLLDRWLRPVPPGVTGEIWLGGEGVARGYLGDPAGTAERFVPDPYGEAPGARLYRTGDLGRRSRDGNIEFVGRNDFQVKIRGYRIELAEIEAALASHPSVREAVAAPREEPGGGRHLAAWIVVKGGNGGTPPTPSDLRAVLRRKLPDSMIPSAFFFVDALPLTTTGKIDRRALGRLGAAQPAREREFVAPRSSVEQVIAGIWSQLLGVERVGIEDDFFELGGHSLVATQVISRVREAFQTEVPLRRIFEHPTVESLAESLIQSPAVSGSLERRASLLLRLAAMSENEIDSLLGDGRSTPEEGASR